MNTLNKPGEIKRHLEKFKTNGLVNYEKLFAIPTEQRIAALAIDYTPKVLGAHIGIAITTALKQLNLKNSMTGDQVAALSAAIIEEAHEDNLAMEDLLMFLQHLVRGKMGPLYDRIDMATFLEKFEIYREDRWQAYKNIRKEKELNMKTWGHAPRSSEEADINIRESLKEQLKKTHGAQG